MKRPWRRPPVPTCVSIADPIIVALRRRVAELESRQTVGVGVQKQTDFDGGTSYRGVISLGGEPIWTGDPVTLADAVKRAEATGVRPFYSGYNWGRRDDEGSFYSDLASEMAKASARAQFRNALAWLVGDEFTNEDEVA